MNKSEKVHKASNTLFIKNGERYPGQLAEYETLTKGFFSDKALTGKDPWGRGEGFLC